MPTMLDIFCGHGGWTIPALAAGWDAIGIDQVDHGYPGTLVLATCPLPLTTLQALHPDAVRISPPCEEFARFHLPWIAHTTRPSLVLMQWSLALIGRLPNVIIECSLFAARHFPGARIIGSYALWGDVPVLMPHIPRAKQKVSGRYPDRRAIIPEELASWTLPRTKGLK